MRAYYRLKDNQRGIGAFRFPKVEWSIGASQIDGAGAIKYSDPVRA